MKTPGHALLLAATQAGVSDPLTNIEVGGDHRQLGQGLDGAGLRDAGNCDQKVEPELQLRIAGDNLQGFARQSLRGPLMKELAGIKKRCTCPDLSGCATREWGETFIDQARGEAQGVETNKED